MQAARQAIEKQDGVITSIFPPSAFIGKIPLSIKDTLLTISSIKKILYTKIDLQNYTNTPESTKDAIRAWNVSLEPQEKGDSINSFELKNPIDYKIIFPNDLPKTKAEKLSKNREFQRRYSKNVKLASLSTANTVFGKAYGAGYYDTSLYLAGDIAVGVFFTKNTVSWTSAEIATAHSLITNTLNNLGRENPDARITFTAVKEVDTKGTPKVPPVDLAGRRDYVNNLRKTYNTHWAFMVIVGKQARSSEVTQGGPYFSVINEMLKSDGTGESFLRRMVLYIFGALEQLPSSSTNNPMSPAIQGGYLNVVNANSLYNDGTGYFQGAGESWARDIMLDVGFLNMNIYTRGQIGWRDADGDGILDPLDTFPEVSQLTRFGRYPLSPSYYTGKATDIALPNEYPASFNFSDVTLNTIATVEYRLNQGGWLPAQPQDGAFDSAEENFKITLPELPKGKYLLEVRAVNSAGNVEKSFARDEIIVNNSSVTNTPPFANFSISPAKGGPETNFTFDASSSSDLEEPVSYILNQIKPFPKLRWDFENDGIWDTSFSTTRTASFRYAAAGDKTVKLEIIDSAGLTTSITKPLSVLPANLPPTAFFTVTPESQHGENHSLYYLLICLLPPSLQLPLRASTEILTPLRLA